MLQMCANGTAVFSVQLCAHGTAVFSVQLCVHGTHVCSWCSCVLSTAMCSWYHCELGTDVCSWYSCVHMVALQHAVCHSACLQLEAGRERQEGTTWQETGKPHRGGLQVTMATSQDVIATWLSKQQVNVAKNNWLPFLCHTHFSMLLWIMKCIGHTLSIGTAGFTHQVQLQHLYLFI